MVTFRALVVRGEHVPVGRVVGGEEIAQAIVDLAAPRGRLQLVGDLAQQLVAEPVAPARHRLEDLALDERGQRRVELVGPDRHRGGQQRAIDLLTRRGRGRRDRQGRRRGVEAGDERLIERLGDRSGHRRDAADPGRGAKLARADQLLEVQRDPAAARGEVRASLLGEVAAERVDERHAPVGRQRLKLDGFPEPCLRVARGPEDEHPPGPGPHQVGQQCPRGVVEPVHVLGHDDRGLVLRARDDVVEHRLGDLLLELATLGGGLLVAGARVDAEDRRHQGDHLGRLQLKDGELAGQVLEALGRAGVIGDATAGLDEPADRVQARVEVERRAVQRHDARALGAGLVGQHGHEARLADACLAVDEDARRAIGVVGGRPRPCRPQLPELGLAVDHARRPGAAGRDRALADDHERLQRIGDPLDLLRRGGLDLEVAVDQLPDLVGDDDRPRIGERVQPRPDVGREAVDVVLVQVEVDRAVMHGDADVERLAGAGGQRAHGPHQREPRPHRALGIVLVGHGEAEGRQRPVALELHDVAFEAGLDHVPARRAVAAHELAVRLGLEATGELGRADDVAEHDREPAQLSDAGAELVAAHPRVLAHCTGSRTRVDLTCGGEPGTASVAVTDPT